MTKKLAKKNSRRIEWRWEIAKAIDDLACRIEILEEWAKEERKKPKATRRKK